LQLALVTDAWAPQVNGVVRTLQRTKMELERLGHQVEIISPDQFRSIPCPTYPEIRLALLPWRKLSRQLDALKPDAIHIATEGPIGFATRAYCRRHGLPFSTSYTTRFPEYIAARVPIPASVSYAVLRRFHSSAVVTMVSTGSLMAELRARGFRNLRLWTRGVDTDLFAPERAIRLNLPRPIFLTAGRVAVEKNLAAFLALDLPGSKVVVGEGPQETELRRRFPQAAFLGLRKGPELAGLIAAADVFVFPSSRSPPSRSPAQRT